MPVCEKILVIGMTDNRIIAQTVAKRKQMRLPYAKNTLKEERFSETLDIKSPKKLPYIRSTMCWISLSFEIYFAYCLEFVI